MKTILNDIKENRLKNVYVLYGEEVYLKLQYKDKLLKAMVPDGDTMNFSSFEGKNIDPNEIISLADTMPFFADYRTILIQDSGFFNSSCDEISNYFKNNPSDTTRFIFVESQIDKRNRLYKIIKDLGRIVEFKELDSESLKNWVGRMIIDNKYKITSSNAAYIVARTGSDMSAIKGEVEKLIAYCYGREEITKEDIDTIVTANISNHVFEMIDAIALKEQNKALELYYDLLSLKEEPLAILALLERHFNKLILIRDLKKHGYADNDIAKKTQLHPYYLGKYVAQAKKFSTEKLIAALEDCVDMEYKVKRGILKDKLAVEQLICKYSAGNEKKNK